MKKWPLNLKHWRKVAGFTVIELIVVVAIIATISALVLFNNAKLNSSVLLSNVAYEVGLIVREAQIAGLGVRATESGGGPQNQDFSYSQGVHFNINTPNQVVLFSDKDNNGKYNGATEDVQLYTISNSRAGKILSICAIATSYDVNTICVQGGTDSVEAADVVFTRPNPEAFFAVTGLLGDQLPDGSFPTVPHEGTVVINIGFEGDICRTIVLRKNGSVQVDTSYCIPRTGN